MYKNIFQVSTSRFNPGRYASVADVTAFTETPITAVQLAESRSNALQAFQKWMQMNDLGFCDQSKFRFSLVAPEHYFKGRFKLFCESAQKLADALEADFWRDNGTIRNLIHDLQSSYESLMNTYVMVDYETPVTMDQFIRTADLDTPYYFGEVFDCRFG